MEEVWLQLEEFPNYSISSDGRIRNDVRRSVAHVSTTSQGALKVGLIKDGKQYTRSVKLLVAQNYVEGCTEIFDTPIHLDGDQNNCSVDNLVWRPRWFAWKYRRQLERIDEYVGVGPVIDRKTGLVYKDIVEAGMINGILFNEILMSLVNKSPIFPTWHIFDWDREAKNR